MANEDVLERAKRWLDLDPLAGYDDYHSTKLIRDLAAALREAREDTRRLDWLEMEVATEFEDGKYRSLFRQNVPITRESIDAAMKPPGGEDGA